MHFLTVIAVVFAKGRLPSTRADIFQVLCIILKLCVIKSLKYSPLHTVAIRYRIPEKSYLYSTVSYLKKLLQQ